MTINFDYSGADEALRLLTKLQRSERVSFFDWRSLFRTGGYKTLLENRASSQADFKQFFIMGAKGDLSGAALLQKNVEELSSLSQGMGETLSEQLGQWLPESLNFEHFTISHIIYKGTFNVFDPAVAGLIHTTSLNPEERNSLYLKLSFTLLLRRFQNLERYYLKNFVAIRRYMPFIYALWEAQTEGIISLIINQSEVFPYSEDNRPEILSMTESILSRAAAADRKELKALGIEFKDKIDSAQLGHFLYGYLYTQSGRDGIKESMISPTAVFSEITGEDGEPLLSQEALFFISQLTSLLN